MSLKRPACMLLAAVCLLPGCLDQEAVGEDDATLSSGPTNSGTPNDGDNLKQGDFPRTRGWLNQTFTIAQTGMGPAQVEGSNCVQFDYTDLRRIQSGWVNVSWTSSSPASQEMRLSVLNDGPHIEIAGVSSLSLRLDSVSSHEVHGLLMYLRSDAEAGLDVEVEMKLHWTFIYEGKAPLTFDEFTCG